MSLTSQSTMNDAQLVEAVLKGDAKAQRILYDRFARKMFGVCLRYAKGREEAEDLLQEGFIRIFQKISSYKGEGVLEGWIRRLMINTSLEHLRKQKMEWEDTDPMPEMAHEPEIISKLETRVLLEAIQKMPTGYRIIFNLFAIEGYSHREISGLLNISEGTSKSQYSRARTYLAQVIEKESKHSSSTA